MKSKLYVTGIGPFWRGVYRRHRRAGFTPSDAALVVYGGVHATRLLAKANDALCAADVRIALIDPEETPA